MSYNPNLPAGQTIKANSAPVTIASDQILDSVISGNRAAYWPVYGAPDATEVVQSSVDIGGALMTRGAILTDEGTYRINFANSSLSVPIGTITNIAGNVITGSGFSIADVHLKDYFKLDADAETAWRQIASIDSDTQITLYTDYVGGTSGAASRSLVQPVTGAGASITVSGGQGIITAGTTSGAVSLLNRSVDYGPLVFKTRLSISQRIANQNIRIGFAESSPTPRWFARFRCDGAVSTVNTTIICESARNPTSAPSAAETETTTVTIPNGGNTSQFLDYRVEHLVEVIRFYINNVLVAEHSRSLPSAYDYMASGTRIENVGVPASSTVITLDYVTTKNHNKLEIGVMSDGEKIIASQAPLTSYSFSQAGVIPINTDLLIIDCSQIQSLHIQATSVGTTGVITSAWSNDGVTYVNTSTLTPAGVSSATFNTAGLFFTPKFGKYFRLRLTTATTAGTTTLNVQGSQSVLPQGLNPSVSQTGTWNIATVSTVTSLTTLSNGQTAHSSASTGSPLRVAGRVKTAVDTTLVAGDASDVATTTDQALISRPFAAPELDWSYASAAGGIINTTDVVLAAAAGASIRRYITAINIQNASATTATEVVLKDGATIIWRGYVGAQTLLNSVVGITFPTPLKTTANTALNFACITTAAQVYVNAQGFNAF